MVYLNPKLAGSNIIDVIPQTGQCAIGCSECFYNGGGFYRPLEPLIPEPEDVIDKVCRINSGHDSNLQRELVIETAQRYKHHFFNTSIARFDFPGPVVFTCNGRTAQYVRCPANVMFVRVRANTWDLEEQDKLVKWYMDQQVPVVMTFMRYRDIDSVLDVRGYEFRTHLINDYWQPTVEALIRVMKRYNGMGVRMCGTLYSSLCADCGNCVRYYGETKERIS